MPPINLISIPFSPFLLLYNSIYCYLNLVFYWLRELFIIAIILTNILEILANFQLYTIVDGNLIIKY